MRYLINRIKDFLNERVNGNVSVHIASDMLIITITCADVIYHYTRNTKDISENDELMIAQDVLKEYMLYIYFRFFINEKS